MATLNLTPREAELLCGVIAVMKADITWTDVAIKANFTNAKQARDKWPAVRDKVIACGNNKKGEENGEGAAAAGKDEGTPKKAVPKKRKAAGERTPAKTKKTKKTATAGAEDGEDAHVKPEADDGEHDILS